MASKFQFDIQIRDFTKKTRIDVSADAQTLLFTVINAVTNDPHPMWTISSGERRDYEASFLEGLGHTLGDIQGTVSGSRTITVFDVLHWIEIRGFSNLCPIKKKVKKS